MNSLNIVVTFGGDIFGAAVGVLAAFEFVGLLVTAMAVMQIIIGASSDFITFSFGLFGPRTGGFATGVAATAYVAKKGKPSSGRDITAGLNGLTAYDMLLVDGVFGAVDHIIARGLDQTPVSPSGNAWTDTVALTVVVSGVVSRLTFGETGPFGKSKQGIRHRYPSQDKCWIPYRSRVPQPSVLGLGTGLMAGFLGLKLGGNDVPLAFGIFMSSLILLYFNAQVSVLHYISLSATLVAVPSGSLIWIAIVGIICVILGELVSRIFLIRGDAHIDSPAMVVTVMTTVINLLATIRLPALVPLFQPHHNKEPAVSTCWLFVMYAVTGAVLQLWWQKNDQEMRVLHTSDEGKYQWKTRVFITR